MNTYNNLPLIQLDINEDGEALDAIALVDRPAIKENYMLFNEQKRLAFNEDRRIISGPSMVPDNPIYRKDSNGEYYVTFSKEAIEKAARKFFKDGMQSSANLMHDDGRKVEGLTFFESFISDSNRGILPMKGFEHLPEGTWFVSAYVESPETWQQIKESGMQGFSVQGMFTYSTPDDKESEFLDQLDKLLQEAGY